LRGGVPERTRVGLVAKRSIVRYSAQTEEVRMKKMIPIGIGIAAIGLTFYFQIPLWFLIVVILFILVSLFVDG
jgi:hypothetical protein